MKATCNFVRAKEEEQCSLNQKNKIQREKGMQENVEREEVGEKEKGKRVFRDKHESQDLDVE